MYGENIHENPFVAIVSFMVEVIPRRLSENLFLVLYRHSRAGACAGMR
jgi:hypothetical protein